MRRNSLMYQLSVLLENTSIDKELNELKRVVQYLKRDEDIDISLDELKQLFYDSDEVTLDKKVWQKLENTESNEIKKGDFDKVQDISKQYGKTNPLKLKKELESNTYDRPLIVKFNDRYHLVAGNTRLSTAAAIGMTPKVIIAEIPKDLSEQNVSANVAGYQSPNIFSANPPRKKDKKKTKSNSDKTYGSKGKVAPKSSKYTILRRALDEVTNHKYRNTETSILLEFADLTKVEPFKFRYTSNPKLDESLKNKDKIRIEIEILSDDYPNSIGYLEITKPKVREGDELLIPVYAVYEVGDSTTATGKYKNIGGTFGGLLRFYRTIFDFMNRHKSEIEHFCETVWKAHGVEYDISGADADEKKAEKKVNIVKNIISYVFDSSYDIYRGNPHRGETTILKAVKWFDDDDE
jgi:hypothetical protein